MRYGERGAARNTRREFCGAGRFVVAYVHAYVGTGSEASVLAITRRA